MHYMYTLCMSAQLLLMSDHSLAWSDIMSDQAKRIIMHIIFAYIPWCVKKGNYYLIQGWRMHPLNRGFSCWYYMHMHKYNRYTKQPVKTKTI